ncbi:HNH endonuclease [Agromyces mediolanus]|uniref:HNH endonuclease n=1 Tax=Agromyces mediolanus TaxID=41986 RepID=UPI00203E80A5|nr:HNH endonuclease signature motif containing protein [Agromyces mediolanus]MCM3657409.1 HNH endonuclease [Agromyces mediolanus]
MTHPLDALEADLTSLRAAWGDAGPAFGAGAEPGDGPVRPAVMSDAGLVRALHAAARLRRASEVALAGLAAEVAARSDAGFGAEGLAKRHGHRNAAALVAASTGDAVAGAAKLLRVGTSTRPRLTLTGQHRPAQHPAVADALERGALSLDAADAICTMLERIAPRTSLRRAEAYEAELVRFASAAPHGLVLRAVRHAEARLDPDGVEPRDEAMHQQRTLTIVEEASGMVRITARLDPVTAAPVKAALEAIVTETLHRRRANTSGTGAAGTGGTIGADGNGGTGTTDGTGAATDPTDACAAELSRPMGPVLDDRRTIPQLQADALAELARHVTGCEAAPTRATATVVVRLELDALLSGVGEATVDGFDRPISAAAARRLAVDAEFVPAVLGGEALPLDLGRSRRLFSRAQRLALGERDGGCASCGRNIAYVEAHHIDWWHRQRGRSDLENGVLLCSHCHHQVHREGWRIRADRREVWFVPPPHLDPEQRPRLGGRARFELRADHRVATPPETTDASPAPSAMRLPAA